MNVDNYDMDKIMNLEKRTGVKDGDINEFLAKVTAVENAIKGLASGTVKPEDIKIDGIETEDDKRAREIKEFETREMKKRQAAELLEKRKKEEHERWWDGVQAYKSNGGDEPDEGEQQSNKSDELNRRTERYSSNYSRWEEWIPNDPVTAEEKRLLDEQEEKRKQEEFETANKEWCDNFKADQAERDKSLAKKQRSAEVLRLKGNDLFKKQKYQDALVQYMECLKVHAYDARVLLNIAQSHIKMDNFADAEEFLKRTLYLKPDNVKALSRQAFVLSKTNRLTEALSTARKASTLEPANATLLQQVLDIETQCFDLADSGAIESIRKGVTIKRNETTASTNPATPQLSEVSQTALCTAFDVIGNISTAFTNDLPLSSETNVDSGPSPKLVLVAVDKAITVFSTNENAVAAEESRLCRVHFRTSGAMQPCGQYILDHVDVNGVHIEGPSQDEDIIILTSKCLELFAYTSVGQHSTQVYVTDSGLLARAKAVVSNANLYMQDRSAVRVLIASLKVLDKCCSVTDRGYGKLYCYDTGLASIVSDQQLFTAMLKILLHITVKRGGSVDSGISNQLTTSDCGLLIVSISRVLYEMIQAVHIKKSKVVDITVVISNRTAIAESSSIAASVVAILATVLHFHSTKLSLPVDCTHGVLEALLACSQVESLRMSFSRPLPLFVCDAHGNISVSGIVGKSSVCEPILSIARRVSAFQAICLAILMNACVLQDEGMSIQRAVYNAGGLELAMAGLGLRGANVDELVTVRCAGLLARLSLLDDVRAQLQDANMYRKLCKCLEANVSNQTESISAGDSWILDERSHLVRILASLDKVNESCRTVALQENLVRSLLLVFPTPKTELGEVTAISVTLPPKQQATALLLGNAARCLMPLADDTLHAKILYCEQSHLGIEKLICAMANCSDIRVRKNIAILLAKGCKLEGVKARVDILRGLQIIRELHDKL